MLPPQFDNLTEIILSQQFHLLPDLSFCYHKLIVKAKNLQELPFPKQTRGTPAEIPDQNTWGVFVTNNAPNQSWLSAFASSSRRLTNSRDEALTTLRQTYIDRPGAAHVDTFMWTQFTEW